MPRLTLLLFAIVAVLGFGLAYVVVRPMQTGMTEMQVQSMIDAADRRHRA